MTEPALVCLTPGGADLARRLAAGLGHGVVTSAGSDVRTVLQAAFTAGQPIVAIMALGIVVRILGPLTRDKTSEPPVVVVDEAGRFAVSVLGGHVGANELAEQVAKILGAVPVITTASDVLGLPALDLIGRDWGWKLEGAQNLKAVSAAMIRGEPIAVYQDAGRRDWWQRFGDWPASWQRIRSMPQGQWAGLMLITDLWVPAQQYPTVCYRPPTLVLGVGCRRGVPCAEIESLFQYLCQTRGLSPLCLGLVATVDLKATEPGLQEFAAKHGIALHAFTRGELAKVEVPNPSAKVREKLGIASVAEAAALLGARQNHLVMQKYRSAQITMAIARREEA